MQLEHPDITVVAACRNPDKLLPAYNGEVRIGDLRDSDYLDRVLVGIDIICHAAGWSSFENTGNTSTEAYLEPTLDLINHAIEWRVSRFVNLSSLYAAPPAHRNDADYKGKPRRYWPMMNCLIAVEDYLRNLTESRCQFVNLRPGLYSGSRLNTGLLAWLISHAGESTLPRIYGYLGHLPLVDGRDIGQAFARAALAPIDAGYCSMNISGPTTPSQIEVMQFLTNQAINQSLLKPPMPASLASLYIWLQGKFLNFGSLTAANTSMLDMLKSPLIDNKQAASLIGYDPEVSWQASLLTSLEVINNQELNKHTSQPYRPLNID